MRALVLAIALLAGCAPPASAPPSIDVLVADLTHDDEVVTIELGRDRRIEARLSATTKGNGGVALPGLFVRVRDEHDDGFVHERVVTDWIDMDGDGHLDFVVSGTGLVLQPQPTRVHVSGVYLFRPDTGTFATLRERSPVAISWTLPAAQ